MNYLDVLLSFMIIIIQANELTEQFILTSFSYKRIYCFQIKTFTPYILYKYINLKAFTKFN